MKTQKKTIILIFAAVLIIATTSFALLLARHRSPTPDPSVQSPEQIFKYIDSNDFRNLAPEVRRSYAGRAMEQIMVGTARKYFEIPFEERVAYLDKIIDDMQQRRAQFESRRRQDPNDGRPVGQRRRWPPSQERMRERSESIDPVIRAEINEFRRALSERMQQRGISFRR